jgi:hypothetical protein
MHRAPGVDQDNKELPMLSRLIFTSSLLSLCLAGAAAVVGCTAPSTDAADENAVDESSDELSAAKQQLVGRYYSHQAPPGAYARITLNADGTYSAMVDISLVAKCITWPCLGPESGTWTASKRAGNLRLRLKSTGEPTGRWYDAEKSATQLQLTRLGKTESLDVLDRNLCLADSDCDANEACAVRACLMMCVANDPYCCGPSTCQPKAPPPPPPAKKCGGFAGLPCGANEECIDDPSDSCDPNKGGADCDGICVPKATECGPKVTCGAGEVCCNPLAGICTKPGERCIF